MEPRALPARAGTVRSATGNNSGAPDSAGTPRRRRPLPGSEGLVGPPLCERRGSHPTSFPPGRAEGVRRLPPLSNEGQTKGAPHAKRAGRTIRRMRTVAFETKVGDASVPAGGSSRRNAALDRGRRRTRAARAFPAPPRTRLPQQAGRGVISDDPKFPCSRNVNGRRYRRNATTRFHHSVGRPSCHSGRRNSMTLSLSLRTVRISLRTTQGLRNSQWRGVPGPRDPTKSGLLERMEKRGVK
mmetsp:Transcript_1486/g.3109  ORF Transcript_1486/g.3109 Transcript_1486/m.3109 type:complete len:241 (+) Transcript_1486:97-819(+)